MSLRIKFFCRRIGSSAAAVLVSGSGLFLVLGLARERETQFAQVSILAGRPGCTVQLDAAPSGKTDGKGLRVLQEIEPGDHYIHVRCPDQQQETAYFVSPHVGESLEIRHEAGGPQGLRPAAAPAGSTLEAAEAKIKLRELVKEAVQLRAAARLEEAVQHLRDATKMDAENSDLHRELGITFLLAKDWKRARVEMLEAIHHDPSDADAHNGLGYSLEKLGELEAALKEYRTATHLEPDDPSYRQHYLEALAKLAGQQAEKKK